MTNNSLKFHSSNIDWYHTSHRSDSHFIILRSLMSQLLHNSGVTWQTFHWGFMRRSNIDWSRRSDSPLIFLRSLMNQELHNTGIAWQTLQLLLHGDQTLEPPQMSMSNIFGWNGKNWTTEIHCLKPDKTLQSFPETNCFLLSVSVVEKLTHSQNISWFELSFSFPLQSICKQNSETLQCNLKGPVWPLVVQ